MNSVISFVLILLVVCFQFCRYPCVLHLSLILCVLDGMCACECGNVNAKGWTPLNSASDEGHLDVVKVLLEKKASTEAATKDGMVL